MFIEMFKENASFGEKNDEIRSVLALLQGNVKQKYPDITLPVEQWCYVLLPGRIGLNQWDKLLAAGYRCLYDSNHYPFAMVLTPDNAFSRIMIETLAIQNDFYYFISFADSLPPEDGKLLQWIDALLNNKIDNKVPPYEILVFDCGDRVIIC
ncbi:hypothetical protein [Pseudocitrobacter sp. 73]|uniref:hypothetical protein n=1 Tax=Pseudocitrobacter sp. 73 TaxID=2605731 RepID=UPI0011EFB82D|nr:hypothetical protein [Pseudocitrobacter sp. 73]KAA1047229.1 hypothetical protein F0Q32_20125 [Pseudocitrobacter sp. 73]